MKETLQERLQREAREKLDTTFRYGLQKQVHTNFDDCTPEIRSLLNTLIAHTIAETIKAGVGVIDMERLADKSAKDFNQGLYTAATALQGLADHTS